MLYSETSAQDTEQCDILEICKSTLSEKSLVMFWCKKVVIDYIFSIQHIRKHLRGGNRGRGQSTPALSVALRAHLIRICPLPSEGQGNHYFSTFYIHSQIFAQHLR